MSTSIGNVSEDPGSPGECGAWIWAVVDPIRLEILRVLASRNDATVPVLALRSGATPRTLRRHLEALVTLGVVQERPGNADGLTPGRPPSRFSLRPELRPSVAGAFGFLAANARLRTAEGDD
jgi:predicted ArsR family transcriptional regulator